jgi:hypothetical protein
MAFRGVGGKKPDEGRQNWAKNSLDNNVDARSLVFLINKYHGGDISLAHYWVNQIQELSWTIDELESLKNSNMDTETLNEIEDKIDPLKSLLKNYDLFEKLSNEFWQILKDYHITVLSYISVFGINDPNLKNTLEELHPTMLDALAKSTTIPSEDFEIIYAALRLRADIFITEDKRLKRCAWSLGLNLPLSANSFCSVSEYDDKIDEWKQLWNVK